MIIDPLTVCSAAPPLPAMTRAATPADLDAVNAVVDDAVANRGVADRVRRLAIMDALLPPARRSRLLALWRAAGFVTGALPALFGARAVYATVDAVESFVDRHYGAQIDVLTGEARWDALRASLEACRDDELEHRDEARAHVAGPLPLAPHARHASCSR